jgi:dihydroneopterin aldolase
METSSRLRQPTAESPVQEPVAASTASSVMIYVRAAAVKTTVGVYPHERRGPRTILMDLEIETAAGNNAGLTDELEDTIDYGAVVERVRNYLAREKYSLLERVAECIAALILFEFRAQRVSVSLFKTDVLDRVGSVGVKIERTRPRLSARPEGPRADSGTPEEISSRKCVPTGKVATKEG